MSAPPRIIELTPPGRGAIAVLRIEGPAAVDTLARAFQPDGLKTLDASRADRPIVGRFRASDAGPAERVVVRLIQDAAVGEAVEVCCHGGRAAVERIVRAFSADGVQPVPCRAWLEWAEPDPIRAAAAVDLPDARTERTAGILLDQYAGGLSRAMADIHRQRAAGPEGVGASRRLIDALLARSDCGLHLIHPWRVAVAGRPNVGKSSLINALLGYGRAIVHPTPGTTRDAVRATTAIDGWPVELCDTAGLDPALAAAGTDPMAEPSMRRTGEVLDRADLILLVADQSEPWDARDARLAEAHPGALVVHNKSDLRPAEGDRPPGVVVSARSGTGIESLVTAISRRLVPHPPEPGAAVPFRPEHVDQLTSLR